MTHFVYPSVLVFTDAGTTDAAGAVGPCSFQSVNSSSRDDGASCNTNTSRFFFLIFLFLSLSHTHTYTYSLSLSLLRIPTFTYVCICIFVFLARHRRRSTVSWSALFQHGARANATHTYERARYHTNRRGAHARIHKHTGAMIRGTHSRDESDATSSW